MDSSQDIRGTSAVGGRHSEPTQSEEAARPEAGSRNAAFEPERISVIIVHYRGLEHLKACLDSILVSDAQRTEILVVDNASLDQCSEVLAKGYPSVRFLKSASNGGSSGGWNLGAANAKGNIFVFLNDDVVVEPNWLAPLVESLWDPRVGCVSGLVMSQKEPGSVNSAGGISDWLGFGGNRGIGSPPESLLHSSTPKIFYMVGTVMATRKDVWDRVGPFDERFFMYSEDHDWSWRARLAGYHLLVEMRSVIHHAWHGSGSSSPQMLFLSERNQMSMIIKNYRWPTLLFIFSLYIFVKTLRFGWLSTKSRELAAATPRAVIWNAEHLKGTLDLRAQVQAHRMVSDREIIRDAVSGSLEIRYALGLARHPLATNLFYRS